MHMVVLFALLVLLLVAMTAAALRPVYGSIPQKELKKRGHKGDQVAVTLYQVARHGVTADTLLLLISIVASASAFVILVDAVKNLVALIIIVPLLLLIFTVLPKRQLKVSHKAALKLSPYIAKTLIKIRPVTNSVARLIRRNRPITIHTGLYDKEDLLELLEQQKVVPQNRIEETELELAANVLTFGDKRVADYMVPKRAVYFVKSEDPIGPILLSELHDSGFSRFPVSNHEDDVVGTLYLKSLIEKQRSSGIVSNVMSPDVYYVNDDAPLESVLAAFIKTKHHLFMVVNSFEETVGIITIEDVIEQILGRKIVDEFDQYDDMRAVAAKQATQDSKNHPRP